MGLTFDNLVTIAKRTGVENWRGPNGEKGQVIAAPSSHRGKKGSMGTVVGCTRHHTGTPETYLTSSDYPTYNVVKEGRAGLSNSLSAYGLGRRYGIYVFSEFVSWHAGTWNYQGITDGNGHFLGIEAEGTGAIWTPFQREFYPRLCAAILDFIDEDIDMMPRHADGAMPRGRKTDAANLWSNFSAQVDSMLKNPASITYGAAPAPVPEEDEDMTFLMRNPKGTVCIVGPFGSEWVPTSAEHSQLLKKYPQFLFGDDLFARVHASGRANLATANQTKAIMQDLANEEPITKAEVQAIVDTLKPTEGVEAVEAPA